MVIPLLPGWLVASLMKHIADPGLEHWRVCILTNNNIIITCLFCSVGYVHELVGYERSCVGRIGRSLPVALGVCDWS